MIFRGNTYRVGYFLFKCCSNYSVKSRICTKPLKEELTNLLYDVQYLKEAKPLQRYHVSLFPVNT